MRRATRWVAIFIYVTDACRYLIDVALEAHGPGPRRCLAAAPSSGAYRDCFAVKRQSASIISPRAATRRPRCGSPAIGPLPPS